MRSTEEIYQDLKNKYESTILGTKNKKKGTSNMDSLTSAAIIGFFWCGFLFVLFITVFCLIQERATNIGQILLTLLKTTIPPLAVAIIATYVSKSELHAIQKGKKDFSEREKLYKETVISDLVKEICPTLNYSSIIANDSLYAKAFFEPYNRYKAEDKIEGSLGNINSFELIDIWTEMLSKGEHGEDIHTTMFEGLFSAAICPFSTSEIVQVHKQRPIRPFTPIGHKINMDSPSFEKYYDVYTKNDIICMQILTADVLDILLTFKKQTNISIDMIIKGKMIYIRYYIKDMFELPSHMQGPINKAEIEKIINTLSAIFKLNEDLNKCFQNKQIKYLEKE